VTRPPLKRLGILLVLFFFAMSAIVVRLVFLQVRDAQALETRGESQRMRMVPLPAMRGAITDRYGRELALSLEAQAVYADPRYVSDAAAEADKMAPLLGVRPAQLQGQLTGEGSFVYVARQVDQSVADKIAALELPGIGFLRESKRYYPSGAWGAPQVVGTVGVGSTDAYDYPQGGLELAYNDVLAGKDGEKQIELGRDGNPIPQGVATMTPAIAGQNIVTTIDPQLQYQAQVALDEAVDSNGAKGGTIIMMDPKTGEVLAMATYYPTRKDASKQAEIDRTTDPAVTNVYEPGSVNKVITVSAAIEEKKVPLDEVFHVPDSYTTYGFTIHDAEPHPTERMMLGDIITHSSNVGTIMVAHELGPDLMATYFARYGYGQETGIGLPGESAGLLPPRYNWSGVSMANLPIGQGVAVTPLQMVNVYATVANGGVWTQPQLVKGTIDTAGTFQPAAAPIRRRVVSEATARTVTGMLAHVVASGTGTAAQIPGYWVAGKTGTGKVPDPVNGGYLDKYVASFIGFLPASDPKIVIGVIIDQPSTQYYGGLVAAPVFQQLGKQAIARLRIAPGEHPDFPPSAMHGR
jgi:cell division protein FtsI (penicillin-binding protein 3)